MIVVAVGALAIFGNKNAATQEIQPTTMESEKTASPTTMQKDNSDVTVILDNTGFTPKDITVKTGTKVVWTNSSGETATVNSDNHPNHLLYPFLNLGEFRDGSSLEVVFDKAGMYGYHNHYNASQIGTVTVE
ncbi:MAG: cupredoxin domain-containing protein [Candidatus Levybacteria bacterium]|nr:cupredoxin domain-containing protein [Candidatus Levybacteria bacterium]